MYPFLFLKQKTPRTSSQSISQNRIILGNCVAFKNLTTKKGKGTNLAASVNHSIVKAQISAPLQWCPYLGRF